MAASCIAFVLLIFYLSLSQAAECHGKPSPTAKPNNNAIYVGPPISVKNVSYGELYTVGSGDDRINIVHVWGWPYQMGYAHGQLVKDVVKSFIDEVWEYLEDKIEEAINSTAPIFQPWFLKDVADLGLELALDLEIAITRPFTSKDFLDEIRGLADATGVDAKKLERVQLIGELTKGQCSMFGAWGEAVANTSSRLLQLRALDWNMDGPFKNYPQVTVFHPNVGYGHTFATVGFPGFLGAITGMSIRGMSISEIGVSFPDSSFGSDSRFGIPFTYFLRDILQYSVSIDDAMKRTTAAHRTCSLLFGYGDGDNAAFRGVQYSYSVANFFTDDNLQPTADWHPHIKDTVYWGMDWLCPSYNSVLARQLRRFHGNLTPDVTIHNILPVVQTGDLHVAVYDLTNNFMFVSTARGDGETGPQFAYDRTFIRLNMTRLFV
ncbi:protein dcd1A-like [Corticium candelabrum]|uniref:protein dcd1A-like n=1 Tax=Corticium candelabrum TaxID=121492 RepID=UPI002E2671B1|nr:protein dcd1A-like [Corticium candelabrum]